MQDQRLTARQAAFVAHLVADPKRNASEAARQAGFSHPGATGAKLKRKLAQAIAEAEIASLSKVEALGEEALQRLKDIVSDPTHRDHFKACELSVRMNGYLSEKSQLSDLKSVKSELHALLRTAAPKLAQSGQPGPLRLVVNKAS